MDRRIQKSRKVIMDTFLDLLSKRDFEKITVNEIAERANINRGTFYLHFTDKHDLLNQCVMNALAQLESSCEPVAASYTAFENTLVSTFEYMGQHAPLYRLLLTKNGVSAFHNRIMQTMLQRFEEQIDMDRIGLNIGKDVLVHFLASAAVGVVEWWFMNDMPYSPKDISSQLLQLFTINRVLPLMTLEQ